MNLARILAQVDPYERATVVFVILALIALPAIGKWVSEHDDERDGQTIAMVLAGLTAVGTVIVIVAAVLGPHPV
ncbi:MAG: hypothetical protein ABSE64_16355 [Vulcanimicrobiaceae bacterium]